MSLNWGRIKPLSFLFFLSYFSKKEKILSDSIGRVLQQGHFAALTLPAGMIIVEEMCMCGGGNRLTLKPNVRLGTLAERVHEPFFHIKHVRGLKKCRGLFIVTN